MTGTTSTILNKVIALRIARDKAQNVEFKLLWDKKLKELIEMAENGRRSHDTIH